MFELFPLSFGEFLAFNGVSYRPRAGFADMAFDRFEYERLKGYYEEYLAYGGLPAVALAPDAETKTEILNDVLSSYINFDIRVLADFQKIAELQQLLRVLASRIGNKLDHAKLASIVGSSRPTLVQYLEFLEMTYVIRPCQPIAAVRIGLRRWGANSTSQLRDRFHPGRRCRAGEHSPGSQDAPPAGRSAQAAQTGGKPGPAPSIPGRPVPDPRIHRFRVGWADSLAGRL